MLAGPPVRPGVTAVLVSHDATRWLPGAFAALVVQTVAPDRVVCADTGSADDSVRHLRAAHGAVVALPATTGYGEAVSAAFAVAPRTPWVWLLHDDCAPDRDALERLLEHARPPRPQRFSARRRSTGTTRACSWRSASPSMPQVTA